MENGMILMVTISYLVLSSMFFKIFYIKDVPRGSSKTKMIEFIWNKYQYTIFGKIVSIILCLPMFAILGISVLLYASMFKGIK